MKRFTILMLMVLGLGLIPGPALAASSTVPTTVKIMGGATAVSASRSYSATATTFDVENSQGYFSVQASATGSGTAKIEYLVSLDGTNFAEPSGASDILTGLTGASGVLTASFQPPICKKIKIAVTETGGSSSITPTVYFMYR
jgi:hypothetical protein